MRRFVTHKLKTWPIPFDAVRTGVKTHEVRRTDRDFAVGDVLVLEEWDPSIKGYTGRQLTVAVAYITPPGYFGLLADVCVMSTILLRVDRG